MSKCPNCGKERKDKEWVFYRYGEKHPENLFKGDWCDNCNAFTGSYHNPITKEVGVIKHAIDRIPGTKGDSILGSRK